MSCGRCDGHGKCPSADVLAYYEESVMDSRGNKHPVPAVIINAKQVKQAYGRVAFNRTNVFRRDNFTCQYCGKPDGHDVFLELEHVVPRSKWNGAGSPTSWTNIVTSCRACNRKKADLFLAYSKEHADESDIHIHMPLFKIINGQKVEYRKPKAPKQGEFHLSVDFHHMKHIPEQWLPYISHLL